MKNQSLPINFNSGVPIIEGTIVTRRSTREQMMVEARIYPANWRGVVIYRPGPGRSILLRQARVIARASGRKARHLSYYLVGRDQDGLLYEIFLGLVKRTKNLLFRARLALQQAGLKLANWLLSPGLSSSQKLALAL